MQTTEEEADEVDEVLISTAANKQPSNPYSRADPLLPYLKAAADRGAPPPLVLVLVGKAGNGKSALANLLLGSSAFASMRSATGVTEMTQVDTCECCQREMGPPEGTPLVVVDTVGLSDPTLSTSTQQKELRERLASIERAAGSSAR